MPLPIRLLAFYTPYGHWGAHAGGHQVCRHLDAERFAVSLRPVSDSDADWPVPRNPLNHVLRNRVSRALAWYKLSDLAAELRALPACAAGRIDIIHYLDAEHTARFLPSWVRLRPGRRIRTVGTFHQPPELLESLVSAGVVRQLDTVIVVSPTQEAFFRRYLPADRVRTLLHGVDAAFFRPGPGGSRPSGGALRCITAGHWLRDWSAIGAVVEAFADAPVEFHLVTHQRTGLEGRSNVIVHANVPDDEFLRLYQSADVLFLPLTGATANNTLLEGLACGLPVVTTNLASVAAYVGEDAAILVDGNDPRCLIEALRTLQQDPGRRSAMGLAARARAEARSWDRVARDWEEVYSALVEDGAR